MLEKMRIMNTTLVLLLLLINASCVTQNAQKMQNASSDLPNARNIATTQDSTPQNQIKNDNPVAAEGNMPRAPSKKELSYEPAVVELEGILTIKKYFGPPYYGEHPKTDKKEGQWILRLNEPVDVIGDDRYPETMSVLGVRDIQLVLSGRHSELIGKEVLAKGTLFHRLTAHHHTDVLLEVQSISLRSR
jgi:hypothetical protein